MHVYIYIYIYIYIVHIYVETNTETCIMDDILYLNITILDRSSSSNSPDSGVDGN